MPPSLFFDKLKKGRRKPRFGEPSASASLHLDPAAGAATSPRRRGMLRSLVANRTFYFPGLGTSSAMSPTTLDGPMSGLSPTGIDDPTFHHLAEPAGPEASFLYTETSTLPVQVGAYTAAGWHLVPDQRGGSGQPVRVRKANQDSLDVQAPTTGCGLYTAVFDGHGGHGRQASQLVRNVVPKVVGDSLARAAERYAPTNMTNTTGARGITGTERRRQFVRAFTRAFGEGERILRDEANGVDHAFSGTTATCAWLDGNELYVAWVGDSRCVLGRRVGNGEVRAVDLSWDHKPVRRDEKRRVRAAGGRVTRWQAGAGPQRVWLPEEWLPGLAMTRSVGDTVLSKYGVSAVPEVTVTQVGDAEELLVVASDGVWEFMSSSEVVQLVQTDKKAGLGAMEIAKRLVQEAVRRWEERELVVDDATAVVVFLHITADRKESVFRVDEDAAAVAVGRSRSLGARLRRGRSDAKQQPIAVGEPWVVAGNGRVEAFACNDHEDDDDEDHEDDEVNGAGNNNSNSNSNSNSNNN